MSAGGSSLLTQGIILGRDFSAECAGGITVDISLQYHQDFLGRLQLGVGEMSLFLFKDSCLVLLQYLFIF